MNHTVAVTGGTRGTGKTTSVAVLGAVFADAGADVLLVDCDLANPSLAAALGIPEPDATLRDVSDADRLGVSRVRSRIETAIDAAGEADTGQVLTAIRNDPEVFLPDDETESAFRGAVSGLVSDGYRIKTGGDYVSSLGNRDPLSVTLVPMVDDETGERILEYIGGLDDETTFSISDVQTDCAPDATEDEVRHFLLAHLGGDDPEYELGTMGSTDPSDWFPGAGFRVPKDDTWTFEYQGDSAADLRSEWQQSHEAGTISYGAISFTCQGDDAAPAGFGDDATFEKTHAELQLQVGQSHDTVANIFERIPESATGIDISLEFE